MAKLVDAQTGQLVDIPDDQVTSAFQSGRYGLPKGAPVHVVGADGTVGDVDPEHAEAAFADGARIAGADEYKKAFLEHKYGGIGGSAAALGEGAARGLSLGLSDPLAIGAAHLFGGEKAAAATREHLAGEKEAHPILSTGGEIAGAAAPMLLSGGLVAPAEAETAISLAQGIRTLGALPRGVGLLGDAAEHAVSGILGSTAESALGKAGQAAAKAAIRATVEGGLFGAGSAVSESALQDHELTAEKLFSAVGHAALTAGLLGGAAAGVGKLASEGIARIAGGNFGATLDDAAGEQAWKWLSPRAAESREAARRAGGTAAVGKTVLDEVLKPLIDKEGMSGAAISAPEKLAAIQSAVDRKGQEIGALLEGNAHATVPLSELLRPIDAAIEEHGGQVLGEEKVAGLQRLKASLIRVLGLGEEGGAAAAPELAAAKVPRSGEEVGAYLREHPEAAAELARTGKLPESATHKAALETAAAETPAAAAREVPIGETIAQRRALQQIAYQESKALDPKARVQMLRDITAAWNDVEERALNDATRDAGASGVGTQLRTLNKTFQQLKIAEAAAEKTTAAYAANATFSLGDKMFGAAQFAGGLASAHPATAAGSLATMYGHKWLRNHGNAYSAVLLDRLANIGGMSRAAAEVDAQVDSAVGALLSPSGATRRIPRVFHTASSDEKFDEEADRVRTLSQVAAPIVAAHLQAQTAGLQTHAPMVAGAVAQQTQAATKFLASKLPPTPLPDPLHPSAEPSYAPDQKTAFLRYVEAVNGGPAGILKRVADGTHTPEDVETLAALYPKSAREIRTKLLTTAASRKAPLPYQQRMRIASLLGPSADPTLDQAFLMSMQASYASGAHAAASAEPRTRGGHGSHQISSATISSLRMPDVVAGTFESTQRGHH